MSGPVLPAAEPPPCPTCNGFGSADGLPCGTYARDFGADAPAACPACGGTGEAAPTLERAEVA
jgi:DnaJ-class molecular chaperone